MNFYMVKHYFQDTKTNEVFPIESSFVIPTQAMERCPKIQLAYLEGDTITRFKFIKTVELDEIETKELK